jgi:hypothetical protein
VCALSLVSHVNADGDIIHAWLAHYLALGVTRFHLVVHGSPEENATLLSLRDEYPIEIRDAYEGVYVSKEKGRRLERVLDTLSGEWVLLVDSNEFVEVPLDSVGATIQSLERAGADALAAPMVQRIRADGSLGSPPVIADPFGEFPRCAPDLYRAMGVDASINKFPLIRRQRGRRINAGIHTPPDGAKPVLHRVDDRDSRVLAGWMTVRLTAELLLRAQAGGYRARGAARPCRPASN